MLASYCDTTLFNYTVFQKKGDTKLMAVTLSFLNRFSKIFTDILSGKYAAQ